MVILAVNVLEMYYWNTLSVSVKPGPQQWVAVSSVWLACQRPPPPLTRVSLRKLLVLINMLHSRSWRQL